MDSPSRPLTAWERLYWRLFAVFGTVGLLHEVYVLENRGRLFNKSQHIETLSLSSLPSAELIYGNHACNSHRFLSDEEVRLCETLPPRGPS
jgi:hypothetical protein